MGDIAQRILRKNKSGECTLPLTISAQYGLVEQEAFFNKRIASKDLSNYIVVKAGEFAYNKSYSEGYPWGAIKRLDRYPSGVVSSLYIVFSIRKERINSDFLQILFESDVWHKEVNKVAAEGARNHGLLNITSDDFFRIQLYLPVSQEEQFQIGSFFSELNNLITLHQRKLDNLKKLKSGLLQKMRLTVETTLTDVFWPLFAIDWEQRKLGEIGFIQTGNTPSTANEKHYSTSGIPWITPSDIYNQVVSVPSRYLSEEGRTAARTAPSDSILVTCIASIGKNALINEESGFNQQINSLTPLEEFDPYFLFIDSYHWSETMRKIAASQTMPIINKTEFSKLTTKITNLKEQQKIGKFFRKIDSAIALHQRT